MWRLALLGLCVSLSGCGFQAWHQFPFVAGHDPYLPAGSSENLRRAEGIPVTVEPLQQEPGNVWPSQIEQEPTLETLEQQGGELPNAVPPPALPPERRSSVPPGNQPLVPPAVLPSVPPPAAPGYSPLGNSPIAGAQPPLRIPSVPRAAGPGSPPVAGTQPYQTPQGLGVPSGGTSAYQTITLPNGTTAIVVPNGNGTSTVIRSDGTVETVPTPK
jgi:hypothetical protein